MYILKAKYILTCDEDFTILKDNAIAFDSKILDIDKFDNLKSKFQDAEILDFSSDIIMPGFINAHTHLEFSSNKTTLVYGDFIQWVSSIVKNRDNLCKEAKAKAIDEAIFAMLNSGVTTIGEISSFGSELENCVKSPARFVFFNELLGADENVLEKNWQNFMDRFEKSSKFQNELFIPAVSIHATYSTHPNLTKKLCEFARKNSLLVSTHFMESDHENEWIREEKGEFKEWLKNFTQNPKSFYTISSFIENFKDLKTLFTHCVYLEELNLLDKNLHSITHCAFSNRLLSKKTLDLDSVFDNKINLTIGTDGLSSNISLNFFDELRSNLLIHNDINLKNLAKILLFCSTRNSAKALGLNLGSLERDKIADIAVYEGFKINNDDDLALNLILQTKQIKKLFIGGNEWIS